MPTARSAKAVFLDRDGVLNRVVMSDGKPRSPRSLEQFQIADDAFEALRALHDAGYLLIVATNQPEVSRGIQTRDAIDAMHKRLRSTLPLDDIRVCFHDDADHCTCRKPQPGLLLDAGRDWGVRMEASYMVGDRGKDLEAGRRAGCKTILMRHDYNRESQDQADHCVSTLLEAARAITGPSPRDLSRAGATGEGIEGGR